MKSSDDGGSFSEKDAGRCLAFCGRAYGPWKSDHRGAMIDVSGRFDFFKRQMRTLESSRQSRDSHGMIITPVVAFKLRLTL
uniref:Uncharacterized protein n=1 Tax=Hyaloperonospora arabidopsidis (strain Emoy2) TaxID=559515 RepID=M4BSG8_HYAAE